MKDFNLVNYLKTNKLGAYGMINENYMNLEAVNNPMGDTDDFDGPTIDPNTLATYQKMIASMPIDIIKLSKLLDAIIDYAGDKVFSVDEQQAIIDVIQNMPTLIVALYNPDEREQDYAQDALSNLPYDFMDHVKVSNTKIAKLVARALELFSMAGDDYEGKYAIDGYKILAKLVNTANINEDEDEGDDMTYRGGDTDEEDTPSIMGMRMADPTNQRALGQLKSAVMTIAGDLEDDGFDTADIAEYLKQIIDELNVNLNEGEEAASDKTIAKKDTYVPKMFDSQNIVALAQSGNNEDANIDKVEIYDTYIRLNYKIGKETLEQDILKTKFPLTKGKGPIYVRFNLNGGNYDVSNISNYIYDTTGRLK